MKKIFSIPFPKVCDDSYFNKTYFPFLQKYKDFIHDIYFTYIVDPFKGDGMSGTCYSGHNNEFTLEKCIEIQEKLEIQTSPTFNNVFVNPDYDNFKKFEEVLHELYDKGIRLFQVPVVMWMFCGKLQKEFKDVTFKNTVITDIRHPQEIWNHALAGYNIIHIPVVFLRDEDSLKKFIRLKTKFKKEFNRDIKLVILANENCAGICSVKLNHYRYNIEAKKYFSGSYMSKASCFYWSNIIPEYSLKRGNIIPLRSEYDRILQYVDIIKLHGRSEVALWNWSMNIIKDYVLGKEFIAPKHSDVTWIVRSSYRDSFIKRTRNCKFECWNCNFCYDLFAKRQKIMSILNK